MRRIGFSDNQTDAITDAVIRSDSPEKEEGSQGVALPTLVRVLSGNGDSGYVNKPVNAGRKRDFFLSISDMVMFFSPDTAASRPN